MFCCKCHSGHAILDKVYQEISSHTVVSNTDIFFMPIEVPGCFLACNLLAKTHVRLHFYNAVGFVCTAPAIRECSGSFQYCGRLPSPNSTFGYQDLVCEEDKCRCPNHEYYDYCTCLRK